MYHLFVLIKGPSLLSKKSIISPQVFFQVSCFLGLPAGKPAIICREYRRDERRNYVYRWKLNGYNNWEIEWIEELGNGFD